MATSTRSASAPLSEESVHSEILALEAELTTIAKLRHTTKAEVSTLQERLRHLKAKAGM